MLLRTLTPLSALAATYAKYSPPLIALRVPFITSAFTSSPIRSLSSPLCRPGKHAAAMTSTSEGATNLPYCYKWPRPAVTVDCLIYTLDQGEPWILLIKRKNDPCKGSWALPGGFVDENEGLETAALRELEEETGVTSCKMVQTGSYGDPGRDPRGHTITVAFMAWAPSRASCNIKAGDDAAEAEFYQVKRLPKMAFDHMKIISDAWARCSFLSEASGSSVSVIDTATNQKLGDYEDGGATMAALATLRPLEVDNI